jgi:hypothetical protein
MIETSIIKDIPVILYNFTDINDATHFTIENRKIDPSTYNVVCYNGAIGFPFNNNEVTVKTDKLINGLLRITYGYNITKGVYLSKHELFRFIYDVNIYNSRITIRQHELLQRFGIEEKNDMSDFFL